MSTLMQNLCYATCFACVLFAWHLCRLRPVNRSPSLLLSATFLVFAVQALLLGIMLAAAASKLTAIMRPAMAMTIGPLLLMYFTSAADPLFRFRLRHALHFFPALFIAFELATETFIVDIDYAIITSFGVYTIAVGLKAARGPSLFMHLGEEQGNAYRWLVAGAALLGVSFVEEIIIYIGIMRGGTLPDSLPLLATLILNLAVVGVTLAAALRRPSPFDWLYEFGGPLPNHRASVLTDSERAACIDSFERLLTTDREFSKGRPTLGATARRLGVPARRLSESINRAYGESYSRHMNRLRVEEAKRLIREDPGTPMTKVMFDAGFQTTSSFNKEFRAIECMSPTRYRKVVVG